MPLPAGISTKTVTYGIPLDITGAQGVLNDVTVKPDRDLVWTATGQTIYAKEFAASVSAGGTITVDLPPVDHAGFKDTAGADITNWSYTIAGRIRIGNQSRTFSRVGSAQTGPVLDFIGYVWPTDHRGRLSFGNFTIEGDNTADATKAHSGIRMGNTGTDAAKHRAE